VQISDFPYDKKVCEIKFSRYDYFVDFQDNKKSPLIIKVA
jgi:hypothetical protein